jgi:4-hydroxy-3-methylbut-2-enyl diphosphate reductase IspH
MDTLVINTKSSSNAKLLLELARKLGETGKRLSKEDQEDFLLGTIMKTEKTGKNVSRDTIMKKLKG